MDHFDELLKRIDQMTNEMKKLNERFDYQDLRLRPLTDLIIEAKKVTDLKNLSHSTISNNPNMDKFVVKGKKKILISLDSIEVLNHRKRK